jgi:hypothetical protein
MRTRPTWLRVTAFSVILLTLCTACSGEIDVDQVPGVYRSSETDGVVELEPDGTFSASGISGDEAVGDGGTAPMTFSGRWEVLDNEASVDVIYLSLDGDGLANTVGIQLYMNGSSSVEFRANPDRPASLVLKRDQRPDRSN